MSKDDKVTTAGEDSKSKSADLGDWSPDHFPTSPISIFKKAAILLSGIVFLCLFVAYCSEEKTTRSKDKGPNRTYAEPVGIVDPFSK